MRLLQRQLWRQQLRMHLDGKWPSYGSVAELGVDAADVPLLLSAGLVYAVAVASAVAGTDGVAVAAAAFVVVFAAAIVVVSVAAGNVLGVAVAVGDA